MFIDPQTIKSFVREKYPYLGINKQQEISRLLYEVAKREKIDYTKITDELPQPPSRFATIKDYLLQRRYPSLGSKIQTARPSFPDVTINPDLKVTVTSKPEIKPKNIFIEDSVFDTEIAQRILNQFKESTIERISAYKNHIHKKRFSIEDYNRRMENFYLIRENYDFYKHCPCSLNSESCGYYVINLGSGCPYECSYCVLQDYINSPGIILPVNIQDYFTAIKDFKQGLRCGSGELTDSLAFDHITGYSLHIVEFFRQYPKNIFEFKTKSDNIGLLTSIRGEENIIISWSINPQHIIETVEYFTASLTQRLEAAQKCVDCGYRVAFHFDPIIYYLEWESDYAALVRAIFDRIPDTRIAWISLGTIRMSPRLKKIIENRFPENTILDEEFLVGYDGKLRYPEDVRACLYRKLTSWIREYSKNIPLYLCMEEKSLHRE